MSKQQVTFNEDENAEIEYEEAAIEDDPEVYHQFLTLVDGVVGSLALLQADMDNFLYFKDELMLQFLPPNLLLQLSLISGKLFRSYSDLQFPLWELLRLVRVYSSPWEEKKAALQKMHEDYARKKSQLEVALRRLTTQDAEVKRAARERRVMNWEKLFARVQMARGHGRRWKFRMYDFRMRAAMGVEHLGRYFAEDQSDLESEPDDGEGAEAADEEAQGDEQEAEEQPDEAQRLLLLQQQQMEEKAAAAVQQVTEEFPEIELESLSDFNAEESMPRAPTDVKSISLPADVIPVETADAEVWTHEPEFSRTLHVRIYPARQVKAKQVTVDVTFDDASLTSRAVRLEAQDVSSRAADDKRRMQRRRQADEAGGATDGAAVAFQEVSFPVPGGAPLPGRRAPSLRVSVLNERMDPAGSLTLTLGQLTEAQLLTLDAPALGELAAGDNGDDNFEQRRRALDELGPVEYPLLLNDIEAGQLPMLAYWVRRPLYRTADRDNNTGSVYQLVEDLTGIDLNRVTREELTRERIDACMSPRPMTPQPENVPKEAFDRLNDEFSERFAQLEQEYVNKLKQLEAQLGAARQGEQAATATAAPPPPAPPPAPPELPQPQAETRDRATSAQRSLPASRSGSGGHRQEDPDSGPAPAPAKKVVGIRLPPKPVRPKKNFMIGRPLPAWGEGFPEDFFERMELLGHLTMEHKAQLVARIRAEIARQVEAQLMELSRLAASVAEEAAAEDAAAEEADAAEASTARRRAAAAADTDEVTIPALFMPQRGEAKVYNPRAHLYFQPHGIRGARLTQPPSMLSLPPLPNRPSILNLFDLSTRASHPTAATISVGVPQNSAIQTQLNLLKKAAN